MRQVEVCGISDARDFETLWRLPRLPLTERFGPYAPAGLAHDQELVISLPTGHVQLRRQLEPEALYTPADYSFRTNDSAKARRGVSFFLDFLSRVANGRTFRSAVDIGGNDLFLARSLTTIAKAVAVVEPLCKHVDGQAVDGVQVIGRFIEHVNLAADLPPPDLVVCRHTLEHIARPLDVVRSWLAQCRPECLFIVEIPCFANLVESQRFDAVFHQHFQYFDLDSIRHLLWECGGRYITHAFDRQGPCGGALLVAFDRSIEPRPPRPTIDLQDRISGIRRRISLYETQMELLGDLLENLPKPIYGYGAGLMLATLAYHLRTDFSLLECILDDDPARHGVTYENVPVRVAHPSRELPPPDSCYVVTSLENVRPIYKRIADLQPRRILVPPLA
jgi:hypothetical protein